MEPNTFAKPGELLSHNGELTSYSQSERVSAHSQRVKGKRLRSRMGLDNYFMFHVDFESQN